MSPAPAFDPGMTPPASPGWRILAPLGLGMAAIVLMAAPVFAPEPAMPHLALLVVGVWALYVPRLMPPLLALALGVAVDLALGLPLGVEATLLPAVALALSRVHDGPRRPILLDWLLAGGLIAAYLWGRTELVALGGGVRPGARLLPQLLTTWALVPAVTRLSAVIYDKVIARP